MCSEKNDAFKNKNRSDRKHYSAAMYALRNETKQRFTEHADLS